MVILAAFEIIDARHHFAEQADPLKYKVLPSILKNFDSIDPEAAPSTFALAEFFEGSQAPENIILKTEIETLIEESKAELESYVAKFESEFGEPIEFTPDFDLAEQTLKKTEFENVNSEADEKSAIVNSENIVDVDSENAEVTVFGDALPQVRVEGDGLDVQQGEIMEQLTQGISTDAGKAQFTDITDTLKDIGNA